MDLRTPLAKARGLGSAKEGSHHWWMQRLTAIALIPLCLWIGLALAALPGAGYAATVAWIGSPWNNVLLIALIIAVSYHTVLGLQVVIEDYVHIEWVKVGSIIGLKLLITFLALASVIATIRIAFIG